VYVSLSSYSSLSVCVILSSYSFPECVSLCSCSSLSVCVIQSSYSFPECVSLSSYSSLSVLPACSPPLSLPTCILYNHDFAVTRNPIQCPLHTQRRDFLKDFVLSTPKNPIVRKLLIFCYGGPSGRGILRRKLS
jgi:hypothetical protein